MPRNEALRPTLTNDNYAFAIKEDIAMFGFIFGAVAGGLTMWYVGNRTREFTVDNMKSAVDQPRSSADTAVRAQDRAKEQVHSGHSGTSTIDPSRAPR
jgi:hypothetical protein